ncbi:MAG: hypothetical protein FJX74_04440 [Armatimonadetes bacterium]|nr:hypothetical protein [Armatimonadota bacterium]
MSVSYRDTSRPIGNEAILVVEGDDEFHLLIRLLKREGLEGRIDIRPPYQGVAELGVYLPEVLAKTSGFRDVRRLGVLRDAEEGGIEDALRSVSAALTSVFRSAKLTHCGRFETVDIGPQQRVHVGAFISVPCLEGLCLAPARMGADPAMPCVEAYLECLAAHVTDSTQAQRLKRRLYAFLASRSDPRLRPGQAADANYIDLSDPCWQPLKDFLNELAGGESWRKDSTRC